MGCFYCTPAPSGYAPPTAVFPTDLWSRCRRNEWISVESPDYGLMKQLCMDADDALRRYDAEIERLHAFLTKMKEARTQLYSQRVLGLSLTAPIRRLPPELLVQVMLAADITGVKISTIGPGQIENSYPMKGAGAVCKYWNDTIMTNSQFWSDFTLFGSGAAARGVVAVKTALKRSQSALDIDLLEPSANSTYSMGRNPTLKVFESLFAHSRRWRNVRIFWLRADIWPYLSKLVGGLPALEHIDACFTSDLPEQYLHVFSEAPRLTSLCLSPLAPKLAFPWSQITNFELYTSGSRCFEIIPSLRNLDTLRVLVTETAARIPLDLAKAASDCLTLHEKLEYLIVCQPTYDDPFENSSAENFRDTLKWWIEHLECPAIRGVHIGLNSSSPSRKYKRPLFPTKEMKSFIQRSNPRSLTHLHLVDMVISEEDLIQLVEMLPQLEDLCLEDLQTGEQSNSFDRSILTLLDPRFSPAPRLPMLTKFITAVSHQFNHVAFIHILHLRRELAYVPFSSLKKLEVRPSTMGMEISRDVCNAYSALKQEGKMNEMYVYDSSGCIFSRYHPPQDGHGIPHAAQ